MTCKSHKKKDFLAKIFAKPNQTVATIILLMAGIAAIARWYIFHIELKYNLILSLISLIVLSSTWFFFRWLYSYFDKIMPYDRGIVRRLVLQILVSLVFVLIVTRVVFLIGSSFIVFQTTIARESTNLAQLAGISSEILLVFLLNLAHFSYYSLQQWRENELRASNLEKEKSQVQFDNLKNQLNPHFLFNSLTSLDSLIHENPALASDFLRQLSRVFRYVLQSKEKGLVNLETELHFIKNYIALLQTRFGDSLKIVFGISKEALDLQIAPVTLQILIENALKHNIANQHTPLIIKIFNEDNCLIIENPIQLKKQVETSNGQGLTNLISLYSFLSDKEVIIEQTEVFRVKIPLI
ncbi:putative signal transduction histidine kinase [Emticicia oligotrophica DSM 17448]|uniref:Signal transduction histidine kinase n=1 Tax=Emticicia oligotrophica (strain DSM 17448 / CIP 109782 / MTCC 6937 / GPTSA100-15) TaxID=929562 RepID=A0ABM5MZE8_EMTOG|nr:MULTISPECIES: histidine kinase [Emticicia]AFK02488.1 putative signal transduction histidine kinase [Emticicia oligotrophica DSM 17448]